MAYSRGSSGRSPSVALVTRIPHSHLGEMVEVDEEVEPELDLVAVGRIGVDLRDGLRLAELRLRLAQLGGLGSQLVVSGGAGTADVGTDLPESARGLGAAANPRLMCSSSFASSSTQYLWLTSVISALWR
jgi:hypothetical protein